MINKRKPISIMLIILMLLQLILPIVPSYAQIYSDSYTIEDGYIKAVQPGTTVAYLINKIQTEEEIVIKSNGQEQSETAVLGTGMTAHIGNETYIIIVKGDVNSDGRVSTTDLSQIRKHLSYIQELEGDGKYAVDINLDGKISATDLSQMRRLLAYKLDVTPPSKTQVELVDYEQGSWTNKTVTQIFSATDDESGIGRYETYRFDAQNSTWTEEPNPSDIVEEGIYTKRARAKDKEGNVGEASEEYTVKIDKTGPQIENIETTKTITSITITVTAQDVLSGIKEYRYSKDNGQTWSSAETTGNYTYNNLEVGTEYKIRVRVIDQAGNETTSEAQTIETINLPGASDIQFSQTPEEETKDSVEVTVIWPELEQGLKKKISVDGVTWEDYTGPITVTENKKIYAKVETQDGTSGEIAEYEITNIDSEQVNITVTGPDKEYIRQGEIATYTITSNKEISIKDIEKIKVEGCTVEVTGSGKTYAVKVTGGTQTKEVELVIEQGAFEDRVGYENEETRKQGLAILNEQLTLKGEETVYAVKGEEYIDAGYELTNGGDIIQVEVIPENIDTNTTEDKEITYNVKYKGEILQTKTRTVKILIPPERIEIQGEEYVKVGGQTVYSVNYMPEKVDVYKNITWTSEAEEIATVDEEGNIIGIAVGTTIIKAITENGVEATKQITVTDLTGGTTYHIIPGDTVELTPTSYNAGDISWTTTSEQNASLSSTTGNSVTVTAGEPGTYEVTATGTNGGPSTTYTIQVVTFDATPKEITLDLNGTNTMQLTIIGENYGEIRYESEDEEIATVSNTGLITGLQNGETTISITDLESNTTVQSTVTVVTSPTSISITGETYVKVGGTTQYSVEYLPTTANANKQITWTSENEQIASVDQTGTVTGLTAGEATIKATTENGVETTKQITVTSLTDIKTTYYLKPGGTVTLTPTNNNAGEISWATTSEQNASLSSATGNSVTVTAGNTPGIYEVTATGANGGPSTTYTIEVVTFDVTQQEITIDLGDVTTAQITVTGSNYGDVSYESVNGQIATVSETGLVTGVQNGETTIKVKESKTQTEIQVKVTVQTSPSQVSITGEDYVKVGGTTQYSVTYTPSTANINTEITWTSSNVSVAIIDQSGNIEGKAVGTTTIKAQTVNGVQATKQITVTDLQGGTTHYVAQGGSVTLTPLSYNAGEITWTTSNNINATLSSATGNSVTVTGGATSGTYIITATGANGGPTAEFTVIVDSISPRTSSVKETAGSVVGGWYTTNATISITPGTDPAAENGTGGSGTAGVVYRVNGGEWQENTGTNSITVSITQEGTNTIEHYTYDNVGNKSSTLTYTLKKDTTSPTANIVLTKKDIYGTEYTNANVQISDEYSGVKATSCKWVYTNSSYPMGTNPDVYTGGTFDENYYTVVTQDITLDPLNIGTYYLHVLVADKVGNVQEIISQPMVEEAVAQIGTKYYKSLQDAFAAVSTTNTKTTVNVLKDITADYTYLENYPTETRFFVYEGQNILLQLNNKNITVIPCLANNLIDISGALEISGSGSLSSTFGLFKVNSTGSLVLSGGDYYSGKGYEGGALLIEEGGKAELNISGTFSQTEDDYGFITNYGILNITKGVFNDIGEINSSGETTITGGTFNISSDGSLFDNFGTLTITDGIFNKTDGDLFDNAGELMISGGEFHLDGLEDSSQYYPPMVYNETGGTIRITGGSFDMQRCYGFKNMGNVELLAGTFSVDDWYVIDNYAGSFEISGSAAVISSTWRTIRVTGGSLTISGGTITCTEGYDIIEKWDPGTVTITGGTQNPPYTP